MENVEQIEKMIVNLSIKEIAGLIVMDWNKNSKTGVYFGAKPYLAAMCTMQTVNDNYGMDSGKSIVLYFLSNATTWKGAIARIVKKELNKRVK